MLYFPERIARGDVPNVDFLHLYGPGSLHVLTGWYELFGYSLPAERTFGLLQHVGIILGLFALARAWGRLAATAVAARRRVLRDDADRAHGDGLERRPGPHAVGDGVRRPRRPPRRPAPPAPGVARRRRPRRAGADVPARPRHRRRARRRLAAVAAARRPAARSLLGAVVGLLPMWVHLVMAGPVDAVEGMFVDPVFRLRGGRELPRPPSWDRLDGGLQAVAEEIPPWWQLPHLSASHTLFLWFFVMLARHRRRCVGFAVWQRRATGGRHGPLDRAPRRRPRQRWASCPRPCSAPTRPTCCGSRAWRSRSASSPSSRSSAAIGPRIDRRAAASIGAAVAARR